MAKTKTKVETVEEVNEEVKVSKSKEVTVEFEGGRTRTYVGPDAQDNAKSFISKSPTTRRIV